MAYVASCVSTMLKCLLLIVNVSRCSVADILVLKDLIQDASGRKSEFKSPNVYFHLFVISNS